MICWESLEGNHIMMALRDHYLSSDDNRYYIRDGHLHWGAVETKVKHIIYFRGPPKDKQPLSK